MYFSSFLSLVSLATAAAAATSGSSNPNDLTGITGLLKSDHPPSSLIVSSSNHSSYSKNFNTGKTLGFVTPWNPKGKELTIKYREKFDLVSPVWYTLNSILIESQAPVYEISGGPTNQDDRDWIEKLQSQGDRKVKIVPRFFFDGWGEQDFLAFLSGIPSSIETINSQIIQKVLENDYDGIVLESSAIWILTPLISSLSEALHSKGKTFVLVLPPLRDPTLSHQSIKRANELILKTAAETSGSVDLFSIMTYDHSGSGGSPLDPNSASLNLEPESILRRSDYRNIRIPGPNTPLDFISKNLELFSFKNLEGSDEFGFNSNQMSFQGQVEGQDQINSIESKLLMGLPLYGYTYPIAWISTINGHSVPRKPSLSPIKSKDQDQEAQAKARAEADRRNEAHPYKSLIPVLRAAGEAVVHDQVLEIMKKRPLVRLDESSQEGFVDYTDILPPEKGGSPNHDEPCYYRAYFPTAHTMKERIRTVQEGGRGVGISLWDVGQAGDWLLDQL